MADISTTPANLQATQGFTQDNVLVPSSFDITTGVSNGPVTFQGLLIQNAAPVPTGPLNPLNTPINKDTLYLTGVGVPPDPTTLLPGNGNGSGNGNGNDVPTSPSYRGTSISTNPTNIPDSEIVSQIPYFLQSVLSTPAGALPKGPLWVVTFDNSYDADAKAYIGKSGIPSIINSVADYEPQAPKWNVTKAIGTICSDNFLQTKGCILAQNVTVPGEGIIATGVEGIQSNSYIRSKVGQGRNDFEDLTIGFLNTNVSFVDNVIRPWVIMTGHKGLIARKGKDQYRTNINVHKLGVSNYGEPPFILQTFTFYGACPIQVDSEEYTYNDNGTAVVRTATFTYQWYTVDSSKNKFANILPDDAQVKRALSV
jgi:hypothetical protein